MSIFDDLRNRFVRLEDGKYVVRIENYIYEQTRNAQRPIRWDLTLIDQKQGYLPTKFSNVHSDVGFEILLKELVQLGFRRPTTPEELEANLNFLVGKLVEIELYSEGEFRNIRFIKLLNP